MDSIREVHVYSQPDDEVVNVFSTMDTRQDSVSLEELTHKYAELLNDQNIDVPFTISRHETVLGNKKWLTGNPENDNEITLGYKHPVTYRLDVSNKTAY